MSNGRRVRRALALGATGAGALSVYVPPAQAVDRVDPAAPVIWSGTVPGDAGDAVVVARVQAPDSRHPAEGSVGKTLRIGLAVPNGEGGLEVRADPSSWIDEFADDDGHVELLLFATSGGGRRFGMGFTSVVWSPRDQRWRSDPVHREPPESGGEADPEGPPTTQITMTDATPQMLARSGWDQAAGDTPTSPFPGQYYDCYGGSTVSGYQYSWMSLGKYIHSAGGPEESFEYTTTTTSTSEWGFKAGTAIGIFTAGGRTSFGSNVSSSIGGGHVVPADTTEAVNALLVNFEYQRRRYSDCFYAGQPPAGGGAYGFDVHLLRPYTFDGDVTHAAVPGQVPTGGGVPLALGTRQYRFRQDGQTSLISHAGDVGVGSSLLSASFTWSTTSGSGTTTRRRWFNPSSTQVKYVNGMEGDPLSTGAATVWGHP